MKEHEFAMYRGDDYLGGGTAKELAEKWGVLPSHIRYLSTPAHRRRMNANKKKKVSNARYTVKLGLLDK